MKTLWSRLRSWVSWLVPSDEQLDDMAQRNDALVRDRMADLAEHRRFVREFNAKQKPSRMEGM